MLVDEPADAAQRPSTLRILAIAANPPVSLPTTLVLVLAQPLQVNSRRRRTDAQPAKCAASSMTAATCSSALDGMQPTFRQTPPSVG